MAFEDSVVLCRVLKELQVASDKPAVQNVLNKFENIRLPRVRRMWDDQWDRSERFYKNEVVKPWSKEFQEWVFNGV